ncbi:MAG TPA: hypothetical protein VGG75_37990 [Trebonia sp.]
MSAHLCVSCLRPGGDPKLGGLCPSCAPFRPVRRHQLLLRVRHLSACGNT